jgi:hypothetical protein
MGPSMNFAIYESIRMNATSVGIDTAPMVEVVQAQHVLLVITDAAEGTTREQAIHHLFMAGHHLQENQKITSEAEWPADVRRQVASRQFDPNSQRSWADLQSKR